MKKEDILTGFLIREELIPYLNKLINEETPFALALMDLNNFKKYNDKFGHLFGDEILKYVSSTIRLTFSQGTDFFRYGGDEFILVFPKRDKRHVYNSLKLYNKNLNKRPFLYNGKLFKINASYGLVGYPLDGKEPKVLIDKADKAMYFSKRNKCIIQDFAKIRSIRLNKFVFKIFILTVILSAIFYSITNREKIKKTWNWISQPEEKIKIETKFPPEDIITPGYPCKITLKNGIELKGHLIYKDNQKVILRISIAEEAGYITLDRKIILEIR